MTSDNSDDSAKNTSDSDKTGVHRRSVMQSLGVMGAASVLPSASGARERAVDNLPESLTTGQSDSKPTIAMYAGPTATILNNGTRITSNKAREKYDLPLLTDSDGESLGSGPLRPQRLAAPVTVYIEAYSAHPLESQKKELYAPPDGYVDSETGEFSESEAEGDVPVYEVTLEPDDGLYKLPYMARQANGEAWEGHSTDPDNPTKENSRVPFFPDGSRLVEEIDRFGIGYGGVNNLLSSRANFDFYRPAPPAGYRNGLSAEERTDEGEGDIQPETWGEDFFPYTPIAEDPTRRILAELTNSVQTTMDADEYAGGIWLEGSPSIEETTYWLNLLIDTTKPIAANASQQGHGNLGNRGDRNIFDSVNYITSGIWEDDEGRDKVGAVVIQEEQIFASRNVQKRDDRPGGYAPTGGHGGIVGSTAPTSLTFVPNRNHTWNSEVNISRLPRSVTGVQQRGNGRIRTTEVAVKDSSGNLLPSIPDVSIVKAGEYMSESLPNDGEPSEQIMQQVDTKLDSEPLSGFVLEGGAPYGSVHESVMEGLRQAALRGIPTARVGRASSGGFTETNSSDLYIEGENLAATKARLLLMAAMLKLGALPVPNDPDNPSDDELDAIRSKLEEYQQVFDTH